MIPQAFHIAKFCRCFVDMKFIACGRHVADVRQRVELIIFVAEHHGSIQSKFQFPSNESLHGVVLQIMYKDVFEVLHVYVISDTSRMTLMPTAANATASACMVQQVAESFCVWVATRIR